jgi:MFS family permease
MKNKPGAEAAVTAENAPQAPIQTSALPRGVWALGCVSLCMDASSELVHALLPLYVTGVLGASMVTLGLLEGLAESVAALMKVFSGALSDVLGRRKPLVVLGYTLAALSKPCFPLAQSLTMVFAARCVDRLGKGIRGAPRDALLVEITPPAQLGAAFGLRQSLDSIGALIGPLLAVGLMWHYAGDVRTVLWFAVLPALLAVLILVLGVRETQPPLGGRARRVIGREWRTLPPAFWQVVLIGALVTLARFNEAFLILRASERGLSNVFAPLVLAVMSATYALVAYPAGRFADRHSPRHLLIGGLLVLAAAHLTLAGATTVRAVFLGTALWGVHLGLTQGLLAKLVALAAPPQLRGTAFGVFNVVNAGALFLASALAGALWQVGGPGLPFLAGGVFTVGSVLVLLGRRSR